jgi:hypothetical protein
MMISSRSTRESLLPTEVADIVPLKNGENYLSEGRRSNNINQASTIHQINDQVIGHREICALGPMLAKSRTNS